MRRLALLALCVAACKKQPAQPAAATTAARFCDQDVSGVWLNASDHHYAYRFRDHGDTIRGEFMQREEDGGLTKPDDPVSFELHRSDKTLAGVMRMRQTTQGGRECQAEYGIDFTVCGDKSLQATVETQVIIGEDCKRATAEDGGELDAHRTEFVFVRDPSAPNHPSGGGEAPDGH